MPDIIKPLPCFLCEAHLSYLAEQTDSGDDLHVWWHKPSECMNSNKLLVTPRDVTSWNVGRDGAEVAIGAAETSQLLIARRIHELTLHNSRHEAAFLQALRKFVRQQPPEIANSEGFGALIAWVAEYEWPAR